MIKRHTLYTTVAALAAGLAPVAHAHDVIVVDPNGPVPDIQTAVAAADAGDVVLVRAGVYVEDVVVAGEGITIVGEAPCRIVGTLEVSGVPRGETTLIAGLELRPPQLPGGSTLLAPKGAIDVRNCIGPVRVVDCNLRGVRGQVQVSGPNAPAGGPGLLARDCANVAVIDSVITGGAGQFSVVIIGGAGGSGVWFDRVRRATLMRSLAYGGDGGMSDDGGDGGSGVTVSGLTTLHVDYSACFGGDGSDGDPSFSLTGGDGGHGLVALTQTIWNFQGVFVGGDFGIGHGAGGINCGGSCNGDPGQPFVVSVPMRQLSGHPSRLELPLIVREGAPYSRRVSAVTGERIRHEHANDTGFGFKRAQVQPRLLQAPSFSLRALSPPIVSNDPFGELIENRTARLLPPGVDACIEWQQATAVSPSGGERRTSARPLIILRTGL